MNQPNQQPKKQPPKPLNHPPKQRTIQERGNNIIPTGLNAPHSAIKPPKRFNELDVKILEDTAGVELDEIAFKLEVRMNAINKEIELIDEQIRLFNIINPKDRTAKLRELLIKRDECEQLLTETKEHYQNLGEFYRVSDKIANRLEYWLDIWQKKMKSFSQTKIGKWVLGIAPFFRSRKYLGVTVGKLDTLYKRMEHIVNLRHIPYGEKDDTMGDLIEFMKTANQLEANLQSFFVYQKQQAADNHRTSKTQ